MPNQRPATSASLEGSTEYQGTFEDSPPGWPQFWRNTGEQWRINGRPTPQWERLAAGISDDLGVSRS